MEWQLMYRYIAEGLYKWIMLPFLFDISLKYIFEMVCLIQALQLHVRLQGRFKFLFSGSISNLYSIFTFCYIYLPTHMLPYWAIMCCDTVGTINMSLLPRLTNKLLLAVHTVHHFMLCQHSHQISFSDVVYLQEITLRVYHMKEYFEWFHCAQAFCLKTQQT